MYFGYARMRTDVHPNFQNIYFQWLKLSSSEFVNDIFDMQVYIETYQHMR